MNKKIIGIPRAFFYHRYGILWRKFFEKIGCKVIISPETNKEILQLGINNSFEECCLSYRIYIGHVLYLINKCDYIITTKECNHIKKNEVCTKINNSYNYLTYIIPKEQKLSYDPAYTFFGLIKIGLKLTKNPIKTLYSYFYAWMRQQKYNQSKYNENKNKLLSSNKKILLLSQFYNINDDYINGYIKTYLSKNNVSVISSNYLDSKTAILFSDYLQESIYLKQAKEIIGALYYYKHQVEGIVFVSTHNCDVDSFINSIITSKNKDIPILNLIINENIMTLNLEIKLECFIDIIKRM